MKSCVLERRHVIYDSYEGRPHRYTQQEHNTDMCLSTSSRTKCLTIDSSWKGGRRGGYALSAKSNGTIPTVPWQRRQHTILKQARRNILNKQIAISLRVYECTSTRG